MRWEEVAYELSCRRMPDEERTWLDVCEAHCRRHGVELLTVLDGRRLRTAVRARHATWRELRAAGYSYPEIAEGFKGDHKTVHAAMRRSA
jgi:hypothetical protein